MKANIWSTHFKFDNVEGYLEKSDVNVSDDIKIGDALLLFNKYACIVEDITICRGKPCIQVIVIAIEDITI